MSKQKNQQGFTLIELMVVLVIIGILVAIALPNFNGAMERAKHASVKGNMRVTQTMVENYAVDWGGLYPGTRDELATEAQNKGYWKTFHNPFDGKVAGITDTTLIGGVEDLKAGMVVYFGSGTPGIEDVITPPPSEYVIYGLILDDNGEVDLVSKRGDERYYLSNG